MGAWVHACMVHACMGACMTYLGIENGDDCLVMMMMMVMITA
jgi:hypothetical protein